MNSYPPPPPPPGQANPQTSSSSTSTPSAPNQFLSNVVYTVKCNCAGDIRRLAFASMPTVNDIRAATTRLYAGQLSAVNDNHVLKYVDEDGDLVTLVEDAEVHQVYQSSDKLRISVFDRERLPPPAQAWFNDAKRSQHQDSDLQRELHDLRQRLDALLSAVSKPSSSGKVNLGQTGPYPPASSFHSATIGNSSVGADNNGATSIAGIAGEGTVHSQASASPVPAYPPRPGSNSMPPAVGSNTTITPGTHSAATKPYDATSPASASPALSGYPPQQSSPYSSTPVSAAAAPAAYPPTLGATSYASNVAAGYPAPGNAPTYPPQMSGQPSNLTNASSYPPPPPPPGNLANAVAPSSGPAVSSSYAVPTLTAAYAPPPGAPSYPPPPAQNKPSGYPNGASYY